MLQHYQNTQVNVMFSDSVTSKKYTIKFRNTQDWRIQRHFTNAQSVFGFATIPKCKPAHKLCSVYREALGLHTTLMNPSGWRSASSHHHRRRQRRDGHVCVGAHRKEFSTALTQNMSLKLRTDGVHSASFKLNFSRGNESSLIYSYCIWHFRFTRR
jgi:hypothetical protein